jgi:hypothetical protein
MSIISDDMRMSQKVLCNACIFHGAEAGDFVAV